jgi:hypothetical protein
VKFLCERCKAKYQIPDERVSGKTVRMTCRRCAHVIEVRAAIESAAAPSPERAPLATDLARVKPAPRATEWFASIDGASVGPVPASELRRRANDGSLTESTLVWRDGWDDWRPVAAVPALLAMVREAAPRRAAVRASESSSGASQTPRANAPARTITTPATSRLATAERLDVAPMARAEVAPAAEIAVAPAPRAAPAPVPEIAVAPAPQAATAPAPEIAPPATIVLSPKGPPRILMAGVLLAFISFGAVAGYALFFRDTPPPPVTTVVKTVYVETPAPVGPTPKAPTATAEAAKPARAPVKRPATPVAPTSAPPASTATPFDPGMLPPIVPPAIDPQLLDARPATPGGPLTARQIEEVQQSHRIGLKRTCIDRVASGVANSNVKVRFVVDGTGQVTEVTSSGNDPMTAKCVETEVRRWRFPPTGGTSTIEMPFHFVRQ